MPKQRSNSIGSSSAQSNDELLHEEEMARRMDDRLQEAGDIEVPVESRTRGQVESVSVHFTSGNEAIVTSQSGNAYHVNVDEETCDCPDHVNRGGRCRHMEAVDQAREQVGRGVRPGSRFDREMNPIQVTQEGMEHETAAEVDMQRWDYTDDGFFYIDHPEIFREDMRRLAAEPAPYYHENVLNGAATTFGIELEFVGGDSNAIAAELHRLGLCGTPRMVGYHAPAAPGMWKVERDGSVTSGSQGGEIVSPILRDTPETWQQIETICQVARRHGAQVDHRTGGHVHVGAEDVLDGKRQRWRRFFKLAAGFEPVLFRLSGGEQGRFRGGHYAESANEQNLSGINARLPNQEDNDIFRRILSRISRTRYTSINLQPFVSGKKTVEFRAFNGTLTPGVIQANIKYAVGSVRTSERSRTRDSESYDVTATDKKRGSIIHRYRENNQRSDEAVMRALDALFARKEDKEHILSVLAKNQWAE